MVEVSVKPYILSFKQCINYTLYLSKPYIAFKDLLTLQLSLNHYLVGKQTLIFFLLPFPPLFIYLLYLSPFAFFILRFKLVYQLYIYPYNSNYYPFKFILFNRLYYQLSSRPELVLVSYYSLYGIALPLNIFSCQFLPRPFYIGYSQFLQVYLERQKPHLIFQHCYWR